jgi:DNA segregation ATPase FtsK/SpoIIIE, S-DNA-T family
MKTDGPGELVHGSLFHRLAERFVGWLTDESSFLAAATLAEPDALWHELYHRLAEKELDRLMRRHKPIESALHLSHCLRSFCGRLADIRKRTAGFKNWRDVFPVEEFDVTDVLFGFAKGTIFVSGRIDAVRIHPEFGVEVVDYKLTRGDSAKHDLLQLAIYATLLSHKKPGTEPHGVIEYYDPEFHATDVLHDDLIQLFNEIVRPVLAGLADEAGTPTLKIPAQPDKNTRSIRQKPVDLSERIETCFASFHIDVKVMGRLEAPQLIRYLVKPAEGVKAVSLMSRTDDLMVSLSLPQPPMIEPKQGAVAIDIPKETPDTVFWRDVVQSPELTGHPGPLIFPVGVDVNNRLVVADLADANMCHCLIGGASGSGKSEFLRALAASLMIRNTPDTLKLTIIDPKILTFGSVTESAYLTEPVITDREGVLPCLMDVVEEMDRRYRQLAKDGYDTLATRFEAGFRDLPFHVVIVDEFADLVLAGKDEKKEFERLAARLAAKGRAAGMHLILATQRPDRQVVTPLIKANLPLKICFRVTSLANSKIILDQGGGESLFGRGDLLCDAGKGPVRAQSLYILPEEMNRAARGMWSWKA